MDGHVEALGGRIVDDGHQALDVDDHELGRVLGDVAVLGDDERDGIAHEPHLILRERRARDLGDVRTDRRVPLLLDAGVQVGRHEHGMHPGEGDRLARVDRLDPSPGNVAAHKQAWAIPAG